MLKVYFTLPNATFKVTAKVIGFSKGLICFLFRKIPQHTTRTVNHPENNCSTNLGNCGAKSI